MWLQTSECGIWALGREADAQLDCVNMLLKPIFLSLLIVGGVLVNVCDLLGAQEKGSLN